MMINSIRCDECIYKSKCKDETRVRLEGMGTCLRFSKGDNLGYKIEVCKIEGTDASYTNFVLIGITPFGVKIHASCTPVQLTQALVTLQKMFEEVVDDISPMSAATLIAMLMQGLSSGVLEDE